MPSDPPAVASRPLAVVVVNYASHRLLREHLPTQAQLPGTRVVVVDNHSEAQERVAVTELCTERGWDLVAMADNGGFARGVNAGMRRAREHDCDAAVLLNPDAQVGAEVLAALHAQVSSDPEVVVSPRIVDSTGADVFNGSTLDLRSGHIGRSTDPTRSWTRPWLTGACLAVPLALFDRLGGMDESYFLYWEDVDFSYRAVTAGARLVVRDDLVVVHDEGGTQVRAGRAKSALYYRYNTRNRLRFAARNLDRAAVLRWVLHTPVESTEILLRGGGRHLLKTPELIYAALRGTAGGLVDAVRAIVRRSAR